NASAVIPTVHAATTSHPVRPQAAPPRPTWLAWTSQYDGSSLATVANTPSPVIGNHVPPRKARIAVVPPIAGPIESTGTRWPIAIAPAAKGTRPTRIRPVISSQSSGGRLTPSVAPATYITTIVAQAAA